MDDKENINPDRDENPRETENHCKKRSLSEDRGKNWLPMKKKMKSSNIGLLKELSPSQIMSRAKEAVLRGAIHTLRSSDDVKTQTIYLKQLEYILSTEKETRVSVIIHSGLVPRLTEFLQRGNICVKRGAASILVKMLCKTHEPRGLLISSGAAPVLIQLLTSPTAYVQMVAVWALGRISILVAECRKHLIDEDILGGLSQLPLHDAARKRLLSWTASCMGALCKEKNVPAVPAMRIIQKLLCQQHDGVLRYTCYALVYFTNARQFETLETVVDEGVCHSLIKLLTQTSNLVTPLALMVIGRICEKHRLLSQNILDPLLPTLLQLLESGTPTRRIREMVCRMFVNITAASCVHIQAMLDAYIFPSLICILDSEQSILLNLAAEAIHNSTKQGTAEHCQALVQMGCVPSLCELLSHENPGITAVAMNSLINLMKREEQQSKQITANYIYSKYGVEKLKKLFRHEHEDIRAKVYHILRLIYNYKKSGVLQNLN